MVHLHHYIWQAWRHNQWRFKSLSYPKICVTASCIYFSSFPHTVPSSSVCLLNLPCLLLRSIPCSGWRQVSATVLSLRFLTQEHKFQGIPISQTVSLTFLLEVKWKRKPGILFQLYDIWKKEKIFFNRFCIDRRKLWSLHYSCLHTPEKETLHYKPIFSSPFVNTMLLILRGSIFRQIYYSLWQGTLSHWTGEAQQPNGIKTQLV